MNRLILLLFQKTATGKGSVESGSTDKSTGNTVTKGKAGLVIHSLTVLYFYYRI